MAKRVALILGSTGLVGARLLELLLDDPDYSQVITAVRRPGTRQHARLREVVMDFSTDSFPMSGVTDLFCCLGTTMKQAGSKEVFRFVDYELPMRAAREAPPVARFSIVTAMGSDPKSLIFYNRVKGEVERDLTELLGARLTILRPSLLTGERSEARSGEKIAEGFSRAVSFAFIGPLANYRPIAGSTVAGAMQVAASAATPDGHSGPRIIESAEIASMTPAGKSN